MSVRSPDDQALKPGDVMTFPGTWEDNKKYVIQGWTDEPDGRRRIVVAPAEDGKTE